MFKKWDFIIIAILMIFSFIPEVIFGFAVGKNFNKVYAEISIEGKVEQIIPLTNHNGEETIEFESDFGYNIVIIKDDKIAVLDASCPDKLDVHQGYVGKPGEILVCLPNKFMVEIKGQKDNNDEDIILSH